MHRARTIVLTPTKLTYTVTTTSLPGYSAVLATQSRYAQNDVPFGVLPNDPTILRAPVFV
jgi:hypothetical protein